LFKATDPLGNGGFDFALCSHEGLPISAQGRTGQQRFRPENAGHGLFDPLNTRRGGFALRLTQETYYLDRSENQFAFLSRRAIILLVEQSLRTAERR
jgi:hypothetical protein